MQMIKGLQIKFGDVAYVCPTLSLGALELYGEALQKLLNGENVMTGSIVVIDAAHAALKRNYPDITRDTVAAGVDTIAEVVTALLDFGGLKRKKLLEAASAGTGNVG
jgi:hypothetical protein